MKSTIPFGISRTSTSCFFNWAAVVLEHERYAQKEEYNDDWQWHADLRIRCIVTVFLRGKIALKSKKKIVRAEKQNILCNTAMYVRILSAEPKALNSEIFLVFKVGRTISQVVATRGAVS